MRSISAAVAIAVFASTAAAKHWPGEISPKTIELIERQVVMPKGADPLAAYDRYYKRTFLRSQGQLSSRPVIEGHFMLRSRFHGEWRNESVPVPSVPGAFISTGEYLPEIADGGCLQVTIFFDVGTRRLVELKQEEIEDNAFAICNGVA